MNSTIYYFSSTGNYLAIAKYTAYLIKAELISISNTIKYNKARINRAYF